MDMDIGAQLRHAREARGVSLETLSRATRVQPRILSAIEQNDSGVLPPRPYGRGFVRAYASEVGLDPDGTVRDFFSQFAPVETSDPAALLKPADHARRDAEARPWSWPVGAVLTYAVVGAVVILVGRSVMDRGGDAGVRTPERPGVRADSPAGGVGTTGAAVPTATAVIEQAATPVKPSPVTIVLDAQGPSWMSADVDGQRVVYRIVQPGERVNLKAEREIKIRVGDAGAVTWQVNGRAAVVMGQPGRVRNALVTPDNASRLK